MKIIFIVGHLSREKGGLYYDLLEDLSQVHEISVFTGYPYRGIDKNSQTYYFETPLECINNNFKIHRVGSKNSDRGNFFARMVKYLLLTKTLYRSIKNIKADVVFISSTPPFLGYLAKRIKIGKVIYNAQDLFPDSLVSLRAWNEKNILLRFLRKKEKEVYKYSDKIITISSDMKNMIIRNGAEVDKIEVINNWVNLDMVKPVSRKDNILFDIYSFDRNKFYISYAGNIGFFQNWDLIINIMTLIKNHDITLVIFGDGSYKAKLLDSIKTQKLHNIVVLPLQSKNLLSEVYSFGNLELVPLIKNMTNYAFPSKTSLITSCGNAILGLFGGISEISKDINENRLGFAPIDFDAKMISEFIINYKSEKTNIFDQNTIRTFAEKKYNKSIQIGKYKKILESLFNNDIGTNN